MLEVWLKTGAFLLSQAILGQTEKADSQWRTNNFIKKLNSYS